MGSELLSCRWWYQRNGLWPFHSRCPYLGHTHPFFINQENENLFVIFKGFDGCEV